MESIYADVYHEPRQPPSRPRRLPGWSEERAERPRPQNNQKPQNAGSQQQARVLPAAACPGRAARPSSPPPVPPARVPEKKIVDTRKGAAM